MNMKNLLKGVDYKGLAIRHCEKAVIVVVTATLVWFLMSGVKKAMSASAITPDQIAQLADKLTTNLRNSSWESSPEHDQVKNPNLDEQIKELMTGVDSNRFKLSQPYFFNFVDFGGILRQKPDILLPYNPIAFADKGAVSLYKTDAKGNILFEEKAIRAAPKKKAPEKEDDTKKKTKAAPKGGLAKGGKGGGPGGMTGMGPGGDSESMADSYQGMMSGRMGSGMGMGMGMGAGMGAGMSDRGGRGGTGDDPAGDTGELSGNLGMGQAKKSGGNIRRKFSKQEEDDQFAGDPAPGKVGAAPAGPGAKADPKVPAMRKVEAEEIRGIRWAVITALFPHRDQVREYLKKLHADDPPVYKMVMVERREVQSDGSLSEWAPLDLKKEAEIVRVIPKKRRTPERSEFIQAKALFEGLVMPLPELVGGNWTYHNQRAASEAAKKATTQGGGRANDEGGMAVEAEGATEEQLNSELFGGGAGMTPRSGGLQGMGMGAGGTGMGGGGMPSGGVGRGMPQGGLAGGGMPSMAEGGGGMTARSGQPAGGSQAGQGTVKAQRAAQRSNAEIVQVRFIDYTVEPEHTYQYRLKVVVENPNGIVGTDKDGKPTYTARLDIISDDVAKDETLTSDDWSEPTLPVYVPADTEYYVLERVKTREEAKIQVHKWLADLGDWQFSDFVIKPGDPIGAEVRDYPLVDWEDKLKKLPRFDFSTQDLLLDVTGGDRKMTFLIDGAEVTITESLPTEIFVVDRLGDLVTRNQDFDKYNTERKERESQITTLRKEAEKETTKKSGTTKPETGGSEGFDERIPSRKSTN